MIKINNLNKIYENKSDEPVVALRDINITLPDKGMVFVVGKSGSGKSTLLNLLGSLDKVTSGDIIIDNMVINKMNEDDLSAYRSSYVGFIFQDYCLIDSLNVEENIRLSLDLNEIDNSELIDNTLELVGLEGFNKRYPKTLSAGQKQRTAIARGYIKKPKLLLCDEPTGNLDSKTAKQILTLLKELSKNTLVLIVSHNIDDAYLYGDRIIEISDGQIKDDLLNTSSSNSYEVVDKKLFINNIGQLNQGELDEINEKIKNKQIDSIHSHNELFKKSESQETDMPSYSLKKKKYSFINKLKMAGLFQRKKIISTSIASIISAVIMILFGLCQFFTAFSLNDVMAKTLSSNDQKVFVVKKAYYNNKAKSDINTASLLSISDSDIKTVKESSYKGDIYTLYNYSMPISMKYWMLQTETTINDSTNLKNFYLQEIYGVLPVKETLLKQVFGNYTYVGNLNDKENGIIITDYIADSILYYRSDTFTSYEDILGYYKNGTNSSYAYINAIINTGYRSKYLGLLNKFVIYNEDPSKVSMESIMMSNDYLHFYEDVKNYLGVAYSLNENFLEVSNNIESRNFARFDSAKVAFPDGSGGYISSAYADIDSKYAYDLPENTLGISLSTFKTMLSLPDNTTLDDVSMYNGSTMTLTKYRKYHPNNEVVFEKTVNIKIYETGYFSFIASDDLLTYLRRYDVIPYSFYFDDLKTASDAYMALKEVPFVPFSSYIDAGIAINNVVMVFNDIFVLIAFTLLFGLLLVLAFHTYLNIAQRKTEIGIFKAMGMKNKDISEIFVIQIVFATILIVALFTIGLIVFTRITNNILFDSFMTYLKNPALRSISILSFNPIILLVDILAILLINIVVTLIPFFMMKRVKPLNIIRK